MLSLEWIHWSNFLPTSRWWLCVGHVSLLANLFSGPLQNVIKQVYINLHKYLHKMVNFYMCEQPALLFGWNFWRFGMLRTFLSKVYQSHCWQCFFFFGLRDHSWLRFSLHKWWPSCFIHDDLVSHPKNLNLTSTHSNDQLGLLLTSQSQVGKICTFLIFDEFLLFLLKIFLIFFRILALRVDDSPTREGPVHIFNFDALLPQMIKLLNQVKIKSRSSKHPEVGIGKFEIVT